MGSAASALKLVTPRASVQSTDEDSLLGEKGSAEDENRLRHCVWVMLLSP